MQLSTKHGFAFLCTPKCASTSIEAAIAEYCNINYSGAPGLKHINARSFHRHIMRHHKAVLPKVKIETFCLVREPLEWVHSWYRYRSREGLDNPRNKKKFSKYTGNISFDTFMEHLLSNDRPPYARIGRQSRFIKLKNGKIGVDRIFCIENIDAVADYLSAKVGKRIHIPQKNVSPQEKTIDISPRLLQNFHEQYAEDYEIYEKSKR